MANTFQFDDFENSGRKTQPNCIACEAMLTDALDGTLSAVDQAWFDRHLVSCTTCSEMVADAQRGVAWLEMLKSPRPEPAEDLVARIMAKTSQAGSMSQHGADPFPLETEGWGSLQQGSAPFLVPAAYAPAVSPALMQIPVALVPANVIAFPQRPSAMRNLGRLLLEPRLAMTAAMAFFSIALTLNLLGVRLNEVHASDLSPTNLRHSFYAAKAQGARYYEGLRVVHVMESRVEDLRLQNEDRAWRRSESAPANPAGTGESHPGTEDGQKDRKPAGPGTSRFDLPADRQRRAEQGLVTVAAVEDRRAATTGLVSAAMATQGPEHAGGKA